MAPTIDLDLVPGLCTNTFFFLTSKVLSLGIVGYSMGIVGQGGIPLEYGYIFLLNLFSAINHPPSIFFFGWNKLYLYKWKKCLGSHHYKNPYNMHIFCSKASNIHCSGIQNVMNTKKMGWNIII